MKKYKIVYKKGYTGWFWYAYRIYFDWLVSPLETEFNADREELIKELRDRELHGKILGSGIIKI